MFQGVGRWISAWRQHIYAAGLVSILVLTALTLYAQYERTIFSDRVASAQAALVELSENGASAASPGLVRVEADLAASTLAHKNFELRSNIDVVLLCIVVLALTIVLFLDSKELRAQLETIRIYGARVEDANLKLQKLATCDGLTGIANRRYLDERLSQELAKCLRTGHSLSIILLDVDHFKSLNDEFGHAEGDEVLKQIANLLALTARPYDTVARYGGEEFGVILPGASLEEGYLVAERIRDEVESFGWPLRQITISLGVSSSNGINKSSEMLLGEADQAMYESKSDGRNRTTKFLDPADSSILRIS